MSALHSSRQYPLLIVIAIDLDRLIPMHHWFTAKKIHFKDTLTLMKGAEGVVYGCDNSAFVCPSVT